MTITFEGRVPHPGYASIGMDGEHNAEVITLEGLPEHDGKTVVLNIILANGTADALAVTDGQVTITRNTTLPGTATAWVSILDGTDYVWKSEKILLRVGQLPDIDTPIEQQYPGIVEQAVQAIEEAGQLIGGVPAGGSEGQILSKKTGADYDTEWTDAQGGGLPSGGTTGQLLRKTSNDEGAAAWETVRTVPGSLGNPYSVLFDEWGTSTWEYIAYYINITMDGDDQIIIIDDAGDFWNNYYTGRPIRVIDISESDNFYTMTGLHDTQDDEYLIEIRRLQGDGRWDIRHFLFSYEDGIFIGREQAVPN